LNEEKFNKLHTMTVTIERFIDNEGKLIISKFQINPMQLYSAESLAPLFAKKAKRFSQYCLSLYPMMQPIPGGRGRKKKWSGIAVIDYLEAGLKIHQSNKKKKTQDDSTEDINYEQIHC
jgi:hypothetical protein